MTSDKVITRISEVSSAWLTTVLQKSGALRRGSVSDFDLDEGGGAWSTNARLKVSYAPGSTGDLPASLFLKLVDTDTGDGEFFLPSEVAYYNHDYLNTPDAPLLTCYAAAHSAELHHYHLLLEDVSESHTTARRFDGRPTRAYALALAGAMAALHAPWWGRVELHDASFLARFVAVAQPGVEVVVHHLADRLERHWPARLRELFGELPDRLAAHARRPEVMTLIHGDPNPGNILLAREGVRPVYLIDRQPFDWSITAWSGAYDLAYVMALYWEPGVRRALEADVLRCYATELGRRGVNVVWEQLVEDYRLATAICVTVAVEYWRGGFNRRWFDFKLGLLRRALIAWDDALQPSGDLL